MDNIPLTAAMIPVVEEIATRARATRATGGPWPSARATAATSRSVAAAANVAAAGMAARAGHPIGFIYFLRLGVPATLLSMMIATGYILLRYA